MTARSRIQQIDTALRANVSRELTTAMADVGEVRAAKDKAVVRDWTHKPKIISVVIRGNGVIIVYVKAAGDNANIYRFVDKGTKAHTIAARNPTGKLKFVTGHEPRTRPVAQYDQGSGVATGDWVQKQVVQHPGTEARDFSKTFNKQITPVMRRAAVEAFRRAMRQRG